MHSIMLATIIVKFVVSIIMIILGMRNLSLTYSDSKKLLGVILVFCGIIGYVSSFF